MSEWQPAQTRRRLLPRVGPVASQRGHLAAGDLYGRASIWPNPLAEFPRTAKYEAAMRGVLIAVTSLHMIVVGVAPSPSLRSTLALGVAIVAALVLVARRASAVVGMTLLLAGFVVTPLFEFANSTNMLSIVVGLAFGIFVTQLRPRVALAGMTVWFACFAAIYLASPHRSDVATLIDHGAINVGVAMAFSLIHAMLIRKIAQLDRMRSESFELDLADQLRRDELRAAESARRVLHDQVLFALVRIADTGRCDESSVRSTIDAFAAPATREGRQGDTTAADLIRSALPPDARLTTTAPPRRVDARTAQVVGRALGEVVRNAVRHGDGPISVHLSADAVRHQLTVTNASHGTGTPRPGWGWRNNVHSELLGIGGRAALRRRNDTVVATLTWPREPQRPTTSGPVRLSDNEIGTLSRAAVPAMAAHTYIAVRHTPIAELPLQMIVIAVLWLCLWQLARSIPSRPVTVRTVLGLTAVTAATVTASLLIAGPASLTSYASWVLGLASIPLCFAAFFGSLREAALLSLALLAPTVAMLLTHPDVDRVSATGALLTFVIPWFGYAMGRVLGRVQLAADRDEAAIRDRWTAISARWSKGRTDELLGFTRSRAIPFLQRTLEHPNPVLSQHDRLLARQLAQQVRDELNAPGLLDDALRERLADARARGAEIVIRPVVDADPNRSAALLRALDRLLDDSAAHDRISLHLNPTDQSSSLSFVAPDAEQRVRSLVAAFGSTSVRIDRDDFAVTVVVPPSRNCGMDSPGTNG